MGDYLAGELVGAWLTWLLQQALRSGKKRMMATAPASSGSLSAAVYHARGPVEPLTVSAFIAEQMPGNVAI